MEVWSGWKDEDVEWSKNEKMGRWRDEWIEG